MGVAKSELMIYYIEALTLGVAQFSDQLFFLLYSDQKNRADSGTTFGSSTHSFTVSVD